MAEHLPSKHEGLSWNQMPPKVRGILKIKLMDLVESYEILAIWNISISNIKQTPSHHTLFPLYKNYTNKYN
jgi:hypothetical protein